MPEITTMAHLALILTLSVHTNESFLGFANARQPVCLKGFGSKVRCQITVNKLMLGYFGLCFQVVNSSRHMLIMSYSGIENVGGLSPSTGGHAC